MLSLIKQWFYPALTFVPPVALMADCSHCRRLVVHRAANRLTVHLIDDHKMSDEEVYKTVSWVFERLQDHLKNRGTI